MKKGNYISKLPQIASCLFMMIALLWLTVSLPFVNYGQQVAKEQVAGIEEEPETASNPFSNTTEEKTEGGANTLSEYLHQYEQLVNQVPLLQKNYKIHPDDLYSAFHPEMVLPPPERVLSF